MSEDDSLRGEVTVLHDWLRTIAGRLDSFIAREGSEKAQARRFTLSTVIAAASVVLLALGLIGGLIAAVAW